jgi:NitT/TauT family transport system ATP-binding protein
VSVEHQSNQDKSQPKSRLILQNITKEYPVHKKEPLLAVSDVSFEVIENEVCVLLGPSGCGKSTILHMMAGLNEPTSGCLLFDGKEIHGPGRERGMVFQTYTSFPWLTVYENVEYGMRLNHVPDKERKERANYFIDRVSMMKFRDSYPKQLSGGMKQRVAIARMLANSPEISLMDEPFGALDAETRWHMQELLLDIIDETEMTVVMVTHDIQEALFLADRIVFLSTHPGRLKEIIPMDFKEGRRIGSKEELIDMPGYLELERKILRLMREESEVEDIRWTP